MGCEGIIMWTLFFLPAVVCFAIYEIRLRRWQRKLEDSAFAGLLDED